MELRYCPVALAAVGMELDSLRRNEDTLALTPCFMPSSPRYAPHGHTAMATFTGALRGWSPISP
jgi:hypothetical protein